MLSSPRDADTAARLRAIYDAFPDLISISDRAGRIVEVSFGRQLEGDGVLRPADVVGRSFTEFMTPEEGARQLDLQQRALAGEVVTTEYQMSRGDEWGWAESSGTRLDDDHVLWVTRDVTHRRRAEEELRASEERYRTIVETAAEGIVALDADFRFTFVNERAQDIMGYSQDALLGLPLHTILPRPRLNMADEMRTRRAAGIEERFEAQLRRGDGTIIWVLVSARPRFDADGQFAGSFSMVADISDLKRAEDEHRKLLRRIGVAEDEERRRLAEGLHDGPIQDLAAVTLRLGTLRLGMVDDPERAGRVGEIEEAIRGAIGDLRHVMFALQPPELDDSGIVTSLRTCAAVVFPDDDTVVEVNARLDDEPPPRIAATAYRIAREALLNARRHARAKKIALNLTAVGGGVQLELVDDGIGIPAEIVDNGVAGHLGLRTMRERATAEGGYCTIESTGNGTRVAVWLPFGRLTPTSER